MDRLIFHVDVNSAFLSWEAVRRISDGNHVQTVDLRLVPSAIGSSSKRGVITAKSIPAKKLGVQTGEPVSAALRKCPNLIVVPPDFQLYEQCSKAFMDICREYAPVVEKYSIDECFLDMSGTENIYPDPLKIAETIKNDIRNRLGFTVNVGIGSNKLLAKMASDFEKPDKVHTLFTDEISIKMWPLPVRELFTVGRASAEKLEQYCIQTIGALAQSDVWQIQSILGHKIGQQVHDYANGIDHSPVLSEPELVKGYSNSTTVEEDIRTTARAYEVLYVLCDSVVTRIRADSVKACCVSVTIRTNDFKTKSHQRKLSEATNITSEIFEICKELFRELWNRMGYQSLRLLGVSLTDIDRSGSEQLSMFPNAEKKRQQKVDQAIDDIRRKYGSDMINRGIGFQSKLDIGKKHKARMELERRHKD